MNEISNQRAAEDLQYIRKIMADSRQITADRGDGFIAWGIIVLLGYLNSAANAFEWWFLNPVIVWILLVVSGWLWMAYDARRKTVTGIFSPLAKKLLDNLWTAVLLTMTLLGVIGGISGAINPERIGGVVFIVLGVGYYVQGALMDRLWVRMLGVGWWLGGSLSFFAPPLMEFALAISMMVGLQIIPGLIFRRNWNQQVAQIHD